MVRLTMRDMVRAMLRMVNVKPFTDTNINDALEEAVDDLSNRCPFAVAVDRGSLVRGQREYILPLDILEIIELAAKDEAGTTLDGAITDIAPATGGDLDVIDTTDFPTSGTVLIGSEQISYTGKNATQFTTITRGANSTVAAAHDNGAAVTENGKSFVILTPRSSRSEASADTAYLSTTGFPSNFYTYPGVLGFPSTPLKSGVMNIMIRSFIRPPAMSSDDDGVESLLVSFTKAVTEKAASILAVRLAQDEASQAQAARWLQDYLGDIVLMQKRNDHYERTNSPKIGLETGRM